MGEQIVLHFRALISEFIVSSALERQPTAKSVTIQVNTSQSHDIGFEQLTLPVFPNTTKVKFGNRSLT